VHSQVYLGRCFRGIDFSQHLNPNVSLLRSVLSTTIQLNLILNSSLAKIQPINGLYATIAAPIVYALLGKTRRLAVLPEAALSLVVGETIRRNLEDNAGDHHHLIKSSEMACMVTFLAALITFFAGIFRLGFVNVIGSPVPFPHHTRVMLVGESC